MKSHPAFLILGLLLICIILTGCAKAVIQFTLTSSVPYFTQVGEKITFTYKIANTGNTSIHTVWFDRTSPVVQCPTNRIIPTGGSLSCTAVYTVTANNVSDGKITYKDGVTGSYSGGCGCSGNDSTHSDAQIVLLLGARPSLLLTIESLPTSFQKSGQKINYNYFVRNTGNVDFTETIIIQDNLNTVSCPGRALVVGDYIPCTAVHTSTAEELANGVIQNTAFAIAGQVQSNAVIHEVPLDAQPALSLAITSNVNTYTYQGDAINFTYLVTNNGNVTLNGPLSIVSETLTYWSCPQTATLAAGASQYCTGTYEVSPAFFSHDFTHSAFASMTYNGQTVQSSTVSLVITYNQPATPISEAFDCKQFNENLCKDYPDKCIWDGPPYTCKNIP